MTAKTSQPTLHHVNLKTTRLQEMIDWYGLVLGLRPTFAFPGGAFLTNECRQPPSGAVRYTRGKPPDGIVVGV